MPNLHTLPAEIILQIASHFLDDYIFEKLYLGPFFPLHIQNLPRPNETPNPFHLIRPYTALAMTNRRLWNVLPKKLKRPIPLEIVEYVEMCQQEVNWARPFAKRRGWEYVELDNRRDVRWKDCFWDVRAERKYGRGMGYGSESEGCVCVEVDKGEGCAELVGDEDGKANKTA